MIRLLPDVFQRASKRWRAASRGTASILPFRPGLFISVFLMCCVLSAIPRGAGWQFASGVTLVEVYATVVDEHGAPVPGLGPDDFEVEQDGRRQQVQTFTAGDVPLSLAIALDRSFSLSRDRLAAAVDAAQRLLGELRPADRVTVLAIGSEVDVLAPLSMDRRAAYDALVGLEPWGTTPLFDATVGALDAVQGAPGRRALILITDGDDRYSQTTAAEMVASARRHDVLIYPVALRRTAPSVFAELAGVSGGRSFAVADMRRLPEVLSAIATELRRQYLLGYAPPSADADAPGWRSITVRVRRPTLRVRARDGYYGAR